MFAIDSSVEPDTVAHWFLTTYLGIALWRYMLAMAVIFLSFLLKKVFELVIIRRINLLFSKSYLRYEGIVFEALSRPLRAFFIVVGVHVAFIILHSGSDIPPELGKFLITTVYVAYGLLTVWATYRLVGSLADVLEDVSTRKNSVIDRQFVPFIRRSLRMFVIVIGILTILASLQVDVGSLVTGLGIGGVAMALAAQDSLGNIFGSVALLADRSIKVGDWIVVGDKVNGIVEAIGLRSTRIRTWPQTLVTIPNKLLANEIIDNWSHMPKRRVQQMIGFEYCAPDQMQRILEDLRAILREDDGVDQDYHLVYWTEFGSSALEVMVYYFTKATDWSRHLACRERINMKILGVSRKHSVPIAFQTHTIHFGQSIDPKTLPHELSLGSCGIDGSR